MQHTRKDSRPKTKNQHPHKHGLGQPVFRRRRSVRRRHEEKETDESPGKERRPPARRISGGGLFSRARKIQRRRKQKRRGEEERRGRTPPIGYRNRRREHRTRRARGFQAGRYRSLPAIRPRGQPVRRQRELFLPHLGCDSAQEKSPHAQDSLFRRNGRHGKENVRHMLDAVGTDKDFRAKKEKQKRRGKRKRRDHRILRRVFAKMRGLVVDVPLSHGLSRIPDAAEPIVENRRDDPPHRTVHYEYLSRNPGAASRFL
mmetsp:Transcript_102538/g.208773  ORF Transcript_102538/g.208773 Transcript_102538/m.208773 type:complete len:258 (-) Transcript_102538:228-1001(-)